MILEVKREDLKEKSAVMAKWHMNRSSTLLTIRERQIETTVRYHFTPVRMAIIKKSTNNNAGEDVEKKESPYSVGRNVNWHSHYGEQYGC